MVAPLAHLEVANVGGVASEQSDARMNGGHIIDEPARLELGQQPVHFRGAEEQVHFRQRLLELALVPLHHAAHRDDGLAHAGRLVLAGLDDGVERFLLRRVDEPARVDHDHLGLREIVRVLGATIGELGEVPFAVDGILVAAQCDEAEFHAGERRGGRCAGARK